MEIHHFTWTFTAHFWPRNGAHLCVSISSPSSLTAFNSSSYPLHSMLPVPQAPVQDCKDKSTHWQSAGHHHSVLGSTQYILQLFPSLFLLAPFLPNPSVCALFFPPYIYQGTLGLFETFREKLSCKQKCSETWHSFPNLFDKWTDVKLRISLG